MSTFNLNIADSVTLNILNDVQRGLYSHRPAGCHGNGQDGCILSHSRYNEDVQIKIKCV